MTIGEPPPLPIREAGLVFRAFRFTDVDDVHALWSSPDVIRYLYRHPMTLEDAHTWVGANLHPALAAEGDVYRLAITIDGDDRVVGSLSLALRNGPARQAEIGYALHPTVAGRGYGGTSARVALKVGFEAFGLHRLYARVDSENTASLRICARLGMRREGKLVECDIWDGRWFTEVLYATLHREWRERDV